MKKVVLCGLVVLGLMAAATIQSAIANTRLVGSGASFPAPLYSVWFQQFSRANGDIQVNYQSKGSSAGIRDFQTGVVDFAASDTAMTKEQMSAEEGGVQLLPMTAGEIVLAYNLPGVSELRLSREVYPAIFMGQIKKWNDPRIVEANPGVNLPDQDITVVARAESSGTTFVFTKHLSAVSAEFSNGPGEGATVNWQSEAKMVRSPKNDGVTATVKQTPGAIGYIEMGFARMAKLDMAVLQNKDGEYVKAGGEGGMKALANVEIPEDMIVWASDPAGKDSYPIVTYTWMIFHKKYDDPKKAEALRKMIEYCLDEGQKVSEKAGYIQLPANVVERVREASKNIQ